MALLTNVTSDKRVAWESFSPYDDWAVNFVANVGGISVSDSMLEIILQYNRYRMFRYTDGSAYKIGYGYGDTDKVAGFTEAEAYSEFRAEMHKQDRQLKAQLPLISISQSHYDALFSLYVDTGTWRTVTSHDGKYDVFTAVKNQQWLLVADMLANGKDDRDRRLKEARVLMLADYNNDKDRTWLRQEGINYTITQYKQGISNNFDQKQAEFAYFRQTGAFLPGMSESRKRQALQL